MGVRVRDGLHRVQAVANAERDLSLRGALERPAFLPADPLHKLLALTHRSHQLVTLMHGSEQ